MTPSNYVDLLMHRLMNKEDTPLLKQMQYILAKVLRQYSSRFSAYLGLDIKDIGSNNGRIGVFSNFKIDIKEIIQ